jgi:hypothetical protein
MAKEEVVKKQQRMTNRIASATVGTPPTATLATSALSRARGGGDPAPPDPFPDPPPILDGKEN